MVDRRNGMVVGAFVALGLSVAGQVAAAAFRPPGPLEIALFAALEIGFSVLGAYAVATRAAEHGFLQKKKRVGFSALMRLREAGDTLDRLQSTVHKKKGALGRGGKLDPSLTLEYFDHILSVSEELKGTILASREDWLEVYGEDLRDLRAIETLTRQKEAEMLALEQRLKEMKPGAEERARLIDECEERVHLLDERVKRLKADLPLTVQALAPQFRDIVSPSEKEVREPLMQAGFHPQVIRSGAALAPERPAVKDRDQNRKRPKDDGQPLNAGVNGHL